MMLKDATVVDPTVVDPTDKYPARPIAPPVDILATFVLEEFCQDCSGAVCDAIALTVSGDTVVDCAVIILGADVGDTSLTKSLANVETADSTDETLVLNDLKLPSMLSSGIGWVE